MRKEVKYCQTGYLKPAQRWFVPEPAPELNHRANAGLKWASRESCNKVNPDPTK